ncbi:MAG: CRISPR-associated endonuclease Cas1 [Gammaproteobacteria bacterium]|jgi:CRISPR-associated protein Cas1|nr:CRISPR-associated endonuclease Cas1 [Gammaproteobacteria bacterium]
MSTLVVDHPHITLAAEGGALRILEHGQTQTTIPLALVDRVVLQGSIDLNTRVLGQLAQTGIATLLLSGRQSRRVAIVLGPPHNDAAVRVAQAHKVRDAAFCAAWSRRLVVAKVRAQRRGLLSLMRARPDCRKALSDGHAVLENLTRTLQAEDSIDVSRLRGVEGAASAAYFRALTNVFPGALGFTGRNRRPPRDPVNACLSLAYTLLHFEAVACAYGAGLDPFIGFYHRPAFGRESLACDLIEPLRGRVDSWVLGLFRDRTLRAEHFVVDKGACLLGKQGRAHFYSAFEGFLRSPRRQLRKHCAWLAGTFRALGDGVFDENFDEGLDGED